jgi:hypothetical protein
MGKATSDVPQDRPVNGELQNCLRIKAEGLFNSLISSWRIAHGQSSQTAKVKSSIKASVGALFWQTVNGQFGCSVVDQGNENSA